MKLSRSPEPIIKRQGMFRRFIAGIGFENDLTKMCNKKRNKDKLLLLNESPLENNTDCQQAASNQQQPCAIIKKHKPNSPISQKNESNNFTQTMYNITSIQTEASRRYARNKSVTRCQMPRRLKAISSHPNERLLRSGMASFAVVLMLTSCILIIQTRADANIGAAEPIAPTLTNQDVNQNPLDRSDSSISKSESSQSQSSPSTSSSQNSIVASLSSAVASAAAAAAVAAAQNSLSGGDARSLLSSSHSGPSQAGPVVGHHNQAQRSSSGLNLAIKIADAIPEVPYSILHNMKKLDHAAPFYNVPNKMSGSTKESGQNFISSALTASGSFGNAAEQLTALFRSPLWKRIADGYGEFTSEFRSLFRTPPATPMKGSMSSTSKLLRDISVPALLMLLASSIPSDWRPVRTRRKSFATVGLPQSITGQLGVPSTSELPNLSSSLRLPEHLRPIPTFNNLAASLNGGNSFDPAKRLPFSHQQLGSSNQMQQTGDINLQPLESSARASWLSIQQPATSGQNQNYLGSEQVFHPTPSQALQQPIRRSGESIGLHLSGEDGSRTMLDQHDTRPVKGDHLSSDATKQASPGLFSSLTSSFVNVGQSKLMNRILNANLGNSYRMLSLTNDQRMPIKRDQLSDKQRYTLLGSNDNNLAHSGNVNEQKLSPSSKPFLLSAMTHAITSMFNPPVHHSAILESGSSLEQNKQMLITNDNFRNENHQHIIGDNIINHKDSLLRRQVGGMVEQRDLSQLLPQSWREVVKRTMNNVQQQASSQWKSIEGQLANWVQDKLKTLPAGSAGSASSFAPAASSSSSSSSPASGSASAPVVNILANVGSTAMNILGLGNKNSASQNSSVLTAPAATSSSGSTSPTAITRAHESSATNHKGKTEKQAGQTQQQPSKGTLAGVADLIVNTLTNRSSASQSLSSALSSSTTTNSNHDKKFQAGDDVTSSLSSIVSQYPTLTGAQSESDKTPTAPIAGSLATLPLITSTITATESSPK